jgi:hypothetical protein
MKLIPASVPGITRNAIIRGEAERLGSASRLGCKSIPGGMSEPQVYRCGPSYLVAAACRGSNFPNVFFQVER